MLVTCSVRRATAAAIVIAALVSGCASTTDEAPKADKSSSPATPSQLNFAVYGAKPVIAAYARIAAAYNVDHPKTRVVVKGYATHAEAKAALRKQVAEGRTPDLFLADHDDLTELMDDKVVQPVDNLLGEREVDFGDGYARTGLEAFSADAALQCMPADVSPLVVYYNPSLIDLSTVPEPGHNPVDQKDGWSLDEFGRAALQARGPGSRGLYVQPGLEQIAPFVWSGGGEVVDDYDEPTTLTLSEGASADALEKLLELVRDPALTFNETALARKSALQRFEAGKLGMLLGYRDLTPRLRERKGLTFDVMPLPRLSGAATIARMSGLCISAKSEHVDQAADLLTDVISDAGASDLASTGYVMPANLDVVNDDAFLQKGEQPLNAQVFGREVRSTRLLPSSPRWPVVSRNAARELNQLFYQPVILSLQDRLDAMDETSKYLFNPSKVPSPSATPTAKPAG
jgi:multiple sugar transport system substrate-binding protein